MQKPVKDYTIGTTDFSEYAGTLIRPTDGMILYCEKGRAVVTINFERRILRKGDIVILFSDILFEVNRVSREFLARYIDMSPDFVDDTTFSLSCDFFDRIYDNPIFPTSDRQREQLEAWHGLNDCYMHLPTQKPVQMMIRNQIQNLFLMIEASTMHETPPKNIKPVSTARQLFNRFARLLMEHCYSQHDVRFYADKLCITPYYLSKITSKTLGASPKEIIDRQIVTEMKHLLVSTDLSVKEIADRFHFESTSYMGRYFRRHTGMTPTEYRT